MLSLKHLYYKKHAVYNTRLKISYAINFNTDIRITIVHDYNFESKSYVITGGSSGIGRSLSLELDSRGAQVIVVGRNRSKYESLIEESSNRNIEFIEADLCVIEDIRKVQKKIESLDRLDGIVNNASRNSRFNILETTEQEWFSMTNLNMTSFFLLSKSAIKVFLRKEKGGKIINVGAVQSLLPLQSSFPYVSTKGGILSMTRSIAADFSSKNILVTTVIPGPILTRKERITSIDGLNRRAATLVGRMGNAAEVSDLILFLLSDMNTFMTGNEIVVDGGRIISRLPDPKEIRDGVL